MRTIADDEKARSVINSSFKIAPVGLPGSSLMVGTFFIEGRRLSAQVPVPSSIDDLCQFQHIAGGAPAPMTAGSVFRVRTDFSGLGHYEIQLSLRQVIELL